MAEELVPTPRRYRKQIPKEHKASMDTRLAWLWHQKFGTVQTIWQETDDAQDKTACTLILQAIMVPDLNNIELLFNRLEGGPSQDVVLVEDEPFKV